MILDLVIYISRNNLSLYFSQNAGDYKVFKFENEPVIPLYFYSEDSDFKIGQVAKIKYERSYPNTYHDYFQLIKDPNSTFKFFTKEKKYKDLLLLGVESLLNNFLREILLSSDNISDIREKINLNLVFASDIMQNEINFVGNLFKTAKYNNLKLIYYNYLLLHFLDKYRKIGAYKDNFGKIGAYKGYILIDCLENNLYIDFYNELSAKTPKFTKIGEDLANDPKIKIIAKMLFDLAVLKSGSLVKEKDELPRLLALAKKYSNTSKSEPLITVELSDGSTEKVRLKMKKVKEVLSYEANFTKDFDAVKECEQKAKVANFDLLVVLKNSVASLSLLEKVKSHYNNVYPCNEEIEEVLELFISSPEVIDLGDFLKQESTTKISCTPKNLNGKKCPDELEIVKPSQIPSSKKTPLSTETKDNGGPETLGPKKPSTSPKEVKKNKSFVPKPPVPPAIPRVGKKPKTVAPKPPPPTRPKLEKKSKMVAPKPPPPPPSLKSKGSKKNKQGDSGISKSKLPPPIPPRPKNK